MGGGQQIYGTNARA